MEKKEKVIRPTAKNWMRWAWRPKKVPRASTPRARKVAAKLKEVLVEEGIKKEELSDEELKQKQKELGYLVDAIERRKKHYAIVDTRLDRIPQQQLMFNTMKDRVIRSPRERIRFYLYFGWNGAGKSLLWAYLTVLMALGHEGKKYKLPYLGTKKNIWILTKSWSNVKSVIHPYLLWDFSKTRIPPDEIESINQDNGILKGIKLKNGCEIHVKTYDQGSENLQGWNPDWIWLDEEPVKEDVFTEILARVRSVDSEMLVTMTPLSWLTKVYEYFLEQESDEVKSKMMVVQVSSLDNPFTDKTWALGLTDEEYKLRVIGTFENPTGLVYWSFRRGTHVIHHVEPNDFNDWLKFYRSIDFGTSHPTAVIMLAQDKDDNFYVFDEICESNMLLDDLVKRMNERGKGYEFEYTVRDSAAKREWLEIERLWMKTTPADKRSKWVGDLSNRRTWILYLNTMFKNNKLFISDRCVKLIKELETHYYKEWGKRDGEVNKENDDLLDALRYIIFMIRHNKTQHRNVLDTEIKKRFEASTPKQSFNSL